MLKDKSEIFNKIYPYIFTIIFLILSVLLIYNHELWRDEVKAWLVGSESISIPAFIYNIRDNLGHPYLWSFILYLISHYITKNIEVMKILHLLISTTIAFLILEYAPFNKFIKILMVFSYYFFFEYSIISRNYSIGILAIIIFCILYKNKYKNLIPIGVVLFFMGQGTIYSFIISIVLFVFLLFGLMIGRGKINKIQLSIVSLIVVGEIFFMYWQLGTQITEDTPFSFSIFSIFNKSINEYIRSLRVLPEAIIKAYLPLPKFNLNFWETNLIVDFLSRYNYIFIYLIALILIIIPFFILRKKVLPLYIIGTLSIATVPFFMYKGYVRHYGHFFTLFIICLWISSFEATENYLIKGKIKFRRNMLNIFLIICLANSIVGSGIAYYYDYKYPFSSGKDVANYIEENFNEKDLVIIGYQDWAAEVVAGYLDKVIYYPQSIETDKFSKLVRWDRREWRYAYIDMPIASSYPFILDGRRVLLVISSPTEEEKEKIKERNFEELEQNFTNSIVESENFYLYLFDKKVKKICEYDSSNFRKSLVPLNDCDILLKDDYIFIDVYGEDPYFENKFTLNVSNDIIIAIINFNCVTSSELRIYYKGKDGNYNEEDLVSCYFKGGVDNIYINVPFNKSIENIRIDPVYANVDCSFEEIVIYEIQENR